MQKNNLLLLVTSVKNNNISRGIYYFKEGFSLIKQPVIRRFVIAPLLLNLIIFISFISWSIHFAQDLMAQMLGSIPEWLSFLQWLLWPVFALILLVIIAYGFTIIANLIAAPFYGILSETVELKLTGKPLPSGGLWKEILIAVPRSIGREISKLPYYAIFILLWLGSFIPVIGLASGLLLFLFSAWMMAIQYCDYPADNHKISVSDLKNRLHQQRSTALIFGLLTMLGMMIPLVNLFVMPAAVCGATLFWVEELAENKITLKN